MYHKYPTTSCRRWYSISHRNTLTTNPNLPPCFDSLKSVMRPGRARTPPGLDPGRRFGGGGSGPNIAKNFFKRKLANIGGFWGRGNSLVPLDPPANPATLHPISIASEGAVLFQLLRRCSQRYRQKLARGTYWGSHRLAATFCPESRLHCLLTNGENIINQSSQEREMSPFSPTRISSRDLNVVLNERAMRSLAWLYIWMNICSYSILDTFHWIEKRLLVVLDLNIFYSDFCLIKRGDCGSAIMFRSRLRKLSFVCQCVLFIVYFIVYWA